jgi:hypothetical protein
MQHTTTIYPVGTCVLYHFLNAVSTVLARGAISPPLGPPASSRALFRSGKGVIASLVQPGQHFGRATSRSRNRLLTRRLHVPLPVTTENEERAKCQKDSMIVHYSLLK